MEPATVQVTETIRPDDAGLVRRASAGDVDAFDVIAADRLPGAFRLASAILGSEADAADATQAALIAVWRELPRLRHPERFDEWFQQVIVHECRTRAVRSTSEGDAALIDTDTHDEAAPPAWLLPSVAQEVRATSQPQGAATRPRWLPRRRSERLVLVAAVAILPVALVLGVLVAGGTQVGQPSPSAPAVADGPSPSAIGSAGLTSAAPSGTVLPQDPGSPPPPAEVVASAWTLPTGWRFELDCDDTGTSCGLSLYDEAGGRQDGWPVVIAGSCENSPVAIGPDASVFVACTRDRRSVVYGLDRGGNPLPGWPVSLRGVVAQSMWNDFTYTAARPSIAVGPDGTVFVSTDAQAANAGKRFGDYAINALAPDGSTRAGWPVALGGDMRGFTVAPRGGVIAWWYEGAEPDAPRFGASRTVFTQIDPDGHIRRGWPQGSTGAASGPVVWGDGSIYYVSASGKVWGHDRAGEIIDGWPYELASAVAPTLRADGTLRFIEESRVVVLDRRGKAAAGWPYRSKGTFMGPGCHDGVSLPLAAAADDGTLYLASWDGERSSVVALDADGSAADGWPYKVPTGWRVADLYFDRDGKLTASLFSDDCGGPDATPIRLDSRGKPIGDAPPTPLIKVYEAMRLDGLRTTSGKASFAQGSQIDFDVALANRSSGAITLPHVDDDGASRYAAGSLQTWLEPLVPGPPLWYCLPNPSQGNERYATGGEVIAAADPVTIAPGETMPSLLHASLPQQTTACLPPGEYRFRVEYKRYGAREDDVMAEDDPIDQATLEFSITALAPVVTPIPTPSPRPIAPTPTPPPVGPSPS